MHQGIYTNLKKNEFWVTSLRHSPPNIRPSFQQEVLLGDVSNEIPEYDMMIGQKMTTIL